MSCYYLIEALFHSSVFIIDLRNEILLKLKCRVFIGSI